MQLRSTLRGILAYSSIPWLVALGPAGCALPIDIQGKVPISVLGELPPPPPQPPPLPPPPPPKPPEPPPRVEVRDNMIQIREKIQFEYNKDVIREVSFDLMDEIAQVIKKNPHIKKLRIEGHASAEGVDAYNKLLSDRRAHAVMRHLVERGGVPAEVLIAKGYGEEKPVAPNDTEENREKNRRVEFNIVEQDITKKTLEIDSATGNEKVVGETRENIKAADADEPVEPRDLSALGVVPKHPDASKASATSKTAAASKSLAKPVHSTPAAKTGKPAKPAVASKPAKPAVASKPAKPAVASKPAKAAKPSKLAQPATAKSANKR